MLIAPLQDDYNVTIVRSKLAISADAFDGSKSVSRSAKSATVEKPSRDTVGYLGTKKRWSAAKVTRRLSQLFDPHTSIGRLYLARIQRALIHLLALQL